MSTEFYFPSRTSQRWLRVGPLAGDLDRFATRLKAQGYPAPKRDIIPGEMTTTDARRYRGRRSGLRRGLGVFGDVPVCGFWISVEPPGDDALLLVQPAALAYLPDAVTFSSQTTSRFGTHRLRHHCRRIHSRSTPPVVMSIQNPCRCGSGVVGAYLSRQGGKLARLSWHAVSLPAHCVSGS